MYTALQLFSILFILSIFYVIFINIRKALNAEKIVPVVIETQTRKVKETEWINNIGGELLFQGNEGRGQK